jgi:hypothetical protein
MDVYDVVMADGRKTAEAAPLFRVQFGENGMDSLALNNGKDNALLAAFGAHDFHYGNVAALLDEMEIKRPVATIAARAPKPFRDLLDDLVLV